MLKFLVYFLISAVFIAGFHFWQYGTVVTSESASNAFFYIGIFMFFGGIITLSNATKVFTGIGYVYKSLFNRFRSKHDNYYEYYQTKSQDYKEVYGIRVLILGTIYLIVALVLVAQYL